MLINAEYLNFFYGYRLIFSSAALWPRPKEKVPIGPEPYGSPNQTMN